MPGDLKTGNETFSWWKANKTPPADKEKYASLILRWLIILLSAMALTKLSSGILKFGMNPTIKASLPVLRMIISKCIKLLPIP